MDDLWNNDEIYKNRDAATTSLVAIMAELKYFDEQFLYYGTAYVENGKIKYRINENALSIYQFFASAAERKLCPMPIVSHIQMRKVPSGKEGEIAMEVRAQFVEKLRRYYPKELFQILWKLGNTTSSDQALPILLEWQEELLFCFHADKIQLFTGAVKLAFGAKILRDESFYKLVRWCNKRSEQIQHSINIVWRDKHSYYGFLYWKEGCWEAYSNAELSIVMEHLCDRMIMGLCCTPIFEKHYWFDSKPSWSIKNWRTQFEHDMKEQMNENYFNWLKKIQSVPSVVDLRLFQESIDRIDQEKNPFARKALLFYGSKWHCHKSICKK